MVRRYQLDIVVRGLDRASGPLGRIHGALSRIAHVATGVIVAHGLFAIANGIRTIADNAFDAYTGLELMEASTANLIARELAREERLKAAAAATEGEAVAVYKLADALETAAPLAESLTYWVEELGIRTPFEEEDVLTSFRIAAAYGFTTVYARELATEQERIAKAQEDGIVSAQRLTRALTDVIAGSGLPPEYIKSITIALGQVQAKGKLAAQEIHQLVNAGIGVDLMADAMGMTVTEFKALQEEGDVLANEFIPALVTLFERDFAGAADRIMNTLGGIVLSLKTIGRVLLRDLFGPTFKGVTPILKEWFETLASDENRANIKAQGEALWESFVSAADFARRFKLAIDDAIMSKERAGSPLAFEIPIRISGLFITQDAYEDLEEQLFDNLQPILERVFLAGIDEAVSGAFTGIGLALAAPSLITGIAGLAKWLMRINWLGLVLIAVAGGIGAAWKGNFLGIRDTVVTTWEDDLKPALLELQQQFEEEIPGSLENFKTFWVENVDKPVGDFALSTLPPVVAGFEELASYILGEFSQALGVLDEYFAGEAQQDWDNLGLSIGVIRDNLGEVVTNVTAFGAEIGTQLKEELNPYEQLLERWSPKIDTLALSFSGWLGVFQGQNWEALQLFFDFIENTAMGVWEEWELFHSGSLIPALERFWAIIVDTYTVLRDIGIIMVDALMPLWITVSEFFDDHFLPMWAALNDVLILIWDQSLLFLEWALPGIFGELLGVLDEGLVTNLDFMEGALAAIKETTLALEQPIKKLGGWLNTILAKALEFVGWHLDNIANGLRIVKRLLEEMGWGPDDLNPGGGGGAGFGGPTRRPDPVPPPGGGFSSPSPFGQQVQPGMKVVIINNTAGAAAVSAAQVDRWRRRRNNSFVYGAR